jgi:hypothetical protein
MSISKLSFINSFMKSMDEIWIYFVLYSYYFINTIVIVFINTISTDKINHIEQNCSNMNQFKINILL